jgi:hypothetical protein
MRAYFTRILPFVNLHPFALLLFSDIDTPWFFKVIVSLQCNIRLPGSFISLENGGKSSRIGPACINDPIISGGPICFPERQSLRDLNPP